MLKGDIKGARMTTWRVHGLCTSSPFRLILVQRTVAPSSNSVSDLTPKMVAPKHPCLVMPWRRISISEGHAALTLVSRGPNVVFHVTEITQHTHKFFFFFYPFSFGRISNY